MLRITLLLVAGAVMAALLWWLLTDDDKPPPRRKRKRTKVKPARESGPMMVVCCPMCQSMVSFPGAHKSGKRPCPSCGTEIDVPDKPMTEHQLRQAMHARPPPAANPGQANE